MQPARAPQPRYWPPRVPLLQRKVLDAQMVWVRERDPRPWGVWPWLGPLLTLVAVIALSVAIRPHVPHTGTGRALLVVAVVGLGELLLVVAMRVFAAPVVRSAGGWRTTLGLHWITGRDWAPWGIGLGFLFAARIAINVVAALATHGAAVRQAQNLPVHEASAAGLIVLGVYAVLIAPLIEESLFRGVLLRSFMRRLTFWPAAVVSSTIFGVLHTYEVSTLAGRITLAVNVGLLGVVNCLLVRITGRLTPAVMLHATGNLFAFLVVLAR